MDIGNTTFRRTHDKVTTIIYNIICLQSILLESERPLRFIVFLVYYIIYIYIANIALICKVIYIIYIYYTYL